MVDNNEENTGTEEVIDEQPEAVKEEVVVEDKKPAKPAKKEVTFEDRYKELQSFADRRDAEYKKALAEQEKKLKALEQAMLKAARPKESPEQFMSRLQTEGPSALEQLLKEREDALRSEWGESEKSYKEKLDTQEKALVKMALDTYIDKCRANTKDYPGFAELEPVMQQIVDSNDTLKWGEMDIQTFVKTAYDLAKASTSEEQLRKAEEEGRKKAEEGKIREAKTTSGVKSSKNHTQQDEDLWKMPIDQLEKKAKEAIEARTKGN